MSWLRPNWLIDVNKKYDQIEDPWRLICLILIFLLCLSIGYIISFIIGLIPGDYIGMLLFTIIGLCRVWYFVMRESR